jgi:hypothetical protein
MFGVSDAQALGYAIIFHAINFVPVTLVGWLFHVREQMTLGQAAHVTAPPTEPATRSS